LLERPFHKVVLDRVLLQNQDQETLLNDLVEVLKEVQAYFQEQFISKKNSHTETKKLWSDEYQPKERIQDSWFDL
ncbi:1216_t:CDS:1, partial [Dentiscutata heterogama]